MAVQLAVEPLALDVKSMQFRKSKFNCRIVAIAIATMLMLCHTIL